MPVIHLSLRSSFPTDATSSSSLKPEYIAGFVVVGVIILAVAIWLGVRKYRKHALAKRESQLGAAFLSVRGIRPADEKVEPAGDSGNGFSRNQMGPAIVLPDKVLARPGLATREEIVNFHRQSGNFPQAFAAKPFSFALSAGSPRSSTLEPPLPNRTSVFRNSFMSGSSSQNRFSVMSTASSSSSFTAGTARKVRQLFSPVLPDELLLTKLGEHLTVVQSFDDGWCVVGRENNAMFHTAKSLFKQTPVAENNVELGVVPAWCFLKPVKGLRAERPVRSTSLGVTVQMDGPGSASRGDLISWSNF